MELKKGANIVSPKTGRAKAENPKDIDLKVRVDKDTNDALEQYSKKNNITKAEAARRGISFIKKAHENAEIGQLLDAIVIFLEICERKNKFDKDEFDEIFHKSIKQIEFNCNEVVKNM